MLSKYQDKAFIESCLSSDTHTTYPPWVRLILITHDQLTRPQSEQPFSYSLWL